MITVAHTAVVRTFQEAFPETGCSIRCQAVKLYPFPVKNTISQEHGPSGFRHLPAERGKEFQQTVIVFSE
jgi:hypothetical protein